MASEDVEVELEEVRIETSVDDPRPRGRTPEDVLEELEEALQRDVGDHAINRYLAELVKLLQDDNTVGVQPAANSALCYAAWTGSIPMMDTLIQKGADINTKSRVCVYDNYNNGQRERTPLHMAACRDNVETAAFLVDKGADVNIGDEYGMKPLHEAASRGDIDVVRYLCDKGADPNTQSNGGDTPLYWAVWSGNIDVVRCLCDKGADPKNMKPLCWAAREGDIDVVRYLCDKGADPNTQDGGGWTPLHEAAMWGSIDVVRCLCDMGADLNPKNVDGRTPLHHAARGGKIDVVRCLCEKGADPNTQDNKGQTPLHPACWNGHVEVVKYLVDLIDPSNKDEKSLDPSNKDEKGWNSLYYAIESRHKDVAAFLLGHDKWKEMLRYSSKGTTPMRELIVSMPDVAEVAFNRCITTNEGKGWNEDVVHATSDDFKVDFNYEFLEDFQDEHSSDSADSWHPEKFTKYQHPLNLIREYDCSNLLKHPLVISLLEHKWTRFGRYIFFGNLFIYLIFLAFLTAFGLVVLSPLEKTCVDVLNGSFNGTAPENCDGLSIHEYRFLYVGAAVTILTALLRLATEIFQLCRHPLEYLLDWVNWLEIPLYLCSITFTFVFATPCLCVHSWQWQIGVVAIFLGWVGLITFLQKWPVTGVYVLMFVNILGSFMKIAFLALLLVIAFALAFYMLLFEPDEMRTAFSHPGRAIVKVMAMTTGELDYDELYHQQEGEDEIAFPPVSFFLWIIFLVLMPVLLSNLLVGLAVGDVDRLQKTASENRIGLQIDLILNFEELLESLGIRYRFVIKESMNNYPNVPATLLPKWCKKGTDNSNLVYYPERHKIRRRMGRWYSKFWITDEYSTSGVKISDAIKPPLKSIENLLQMQHQQLEAKLREQGGHQSQHLEAKLKEQSEQLKEQSEHQSQQLDAKLKENDAKQSEQLEAKLKEQSEQLEAKLKEQSEQFEAKLNQHSEKQSEQFQEAVRQLSECHKEQAKHSEEQAKKMEEKTEQLAGEVASLREALEKLVTQLAAK